MTTMSGHDKGGFLKFLAGLALIPYALRGIGSLLVLLVFAVAIVSALLLWLF